MSNKKNRMNDMLAIFGIAEPVIQKLLGKILEKNPEEFFGKDFCKEEPMILYVPSITYSKYSIQLINTGNTHNIHIENYNSNEEMMKCIGYMFYCIKQVYVYIAKTLDNSIINNTSLVLDENTDTYYIKYIHPLEVKKNEIENNISKLLCSKPLNMDKLWNVEWNDNQCLLKNVENDIKKLNVYDIQKKYNDVFIQHHIGISINKL